MSDVDQAGEVLRLSDILEQVEGLADELEREAWEVSGNKRQGECRTVRALTLSDSAARIRSLLEGDEE